MRTFIKIIIVLCVLAAAGVGYSVWESNEAEKNAIPNYRLGEVQQEDFRITIDATGTLEPNELIDVGAQVGGIIMEFGTDENGAPLNYASKVKANQKLAIIDDVLVELDIRNSEAAVAQAEASIVQAEADILQAKAKYIQAKQDCDRAKKLGAGDALSQSSYDQYVSSEAVAAAAVKVSEAALVGGRAKLDAAKAGRDKQLRNRTYTTIVSPVDGVIIDRKVNIGQTVVSSMNAPTLFLIATDLKKMQIWAAVNEADIGRVSVGQKVIFTVDAFQGREFEGKVNKIRLNATMTSNVVSYIVEVDVTNEDETLLPYLTANVQFVVKEYLETFVVPNAALRFAPEEQFIEPSMLAEYQANAQKSERKNKKRTSAASDQVEKVIWKEAGQYVRPVWVKVGESNGVFTPVAPLKDGELAVNDQVITGKEVSKSSKDAEAGSGEGKNPFAPQMPKRNKPSTGTGSKSSPH